LNDIFGNEITQTTPDDLNQDLNDLVAYALLAFKNPNSQFIYVYTEAFARNKPIDGKEILKLYADVNDFIMGHDIVVSTDGSIAGTNWRSINYKDGVFHNVDQTIDDFEKNL
jgi:hypothetical protein